MGQRRHPERRHRRDQRGHVPVRRRRSQHAELHHPSQSVLAFITDYTDFTPPPASALIRTSVSHVYITNNNFFDNFDAAMQIEPNGLLAGNPLTPLESGNPFLRGNVMTGQRDRRPDGPDRSALPVHRRTSLRTSGPSRRSRAAAAYSNLSVNSVWDLTDITYVLQGTLIIAGAYDFGFDGIGLARAPGAQSDDVRTIPAPVVSLTIQAALPGTLLADGETIPSPGQSVIVKLFNDNTPNDVGAANLAHELRVDRHLGPFKTPGPGSSSASTTASIRPPSARWSIRVPTPSCASWVSRATRRPASSACR